MDGMPDPTQIVVKRRLALILPVVVLLIVAELVWAGRVWMALLVALGGIWVFEFIYARSLARGPVSSPWLREAP